MSNNGIANFKAYFNAFDASSVFVKIPDKTFGYSASYRIRENYTLKCNKLLAKTFDNDGITEYEVNGQNVLIYFHPGLIQSFYIMAYKISETSDLVKYPTGRFIDDFYFTNWRILKVGNNGAPFKIFEKVTGFPANNTLPDYAVNIKDISQNKFRNGRVVSSAMRITNVSLVASDVIEIMQDVRLDPKDFAKIVHFVDNPTGNDHWGTTVEPILPSSFQNNELDPYRFAYMHSYWHYHDMNWTTGPGQPSGSGIPFTPSHSRRLPAWDVLCGTYNWSNAPFHVITPTGNINGIQINAVPLKDNREFRGDLNDLEKNLGPRRLVPANSKTAFYYEGFTENVVKNDFGGNSNPNGIGPYYHNKFYPTEDSNKLVDCIFDPDFLGTWIRLIEPDPNLEILIEVITNYEMICDMDSMYYSFQTRSERLDVDISDIRNTLEASFGALNVYDVDVADQVSATIDSALRGLNTYSGGTANAVHNVTTSAFTGGATSARDAQITRELARGDDDDGMSDFQSLPQDFATDMDDDEVSAVTDFDASQAGGGGSSIISGLKSGAMYVGKKAIGKAFQAADQVYTGGTISKGVKGVRAIGNVASAVGAVGGALGVGSNNQSQFQVSGPVPVGYRDEVSGNIASGSGNSVSGNSVSSRRSVNIQDRLRENKYLARKADKFREIRDNNRGLFRSLKKDEILKKVRFNAMQTDYT
jgi:hypothetical protein